jgi:integrase
MAIKLTDSGIRKLSAPENGTKIYYDEALKGFGIRITASGVLSFVLNYRCQGREGRLTIGRFPEWSTTAAREEARALKRRIDQGEDSLLQEKAVRSAATMGELAEMYIERHLPKKCPKAQVEDKAMLRLYILPALRSLKVAAVGYTDIESLHRNVSKSAPYRANRVLSLLSKMFALAVKWGLRPDNPALGIERNPEEKRVRYLSGEEFERFVKTLREHRNQQFANAVRLLIHTGARRNEVLTAEWTHMDLEQGIWTKPSSHTKQKRAHRVPLSPEAVDLLRQIKAQAQPDTIHIFQGRKAGEPIKEVKRFWETLCRKANLENFRMHDIRHHYAATLASNRIPLHIIGGLLGHTQQSTTARYAHLFDESLREATRIVSAGVSQQEEQGAFHAA